MTEISHGWRVGVSLQSPDAGVHRQRRIRPARVLMFLIMAVVAVVMLYRSSTCSMRRFRRRPQYQGTKSGLSLSTWSQLFHSQPSPRAAQTR